MNSEKEYKGYREVGNWKTLWCKETIDRGWKTFWKRRGFEIPPPVSTYAVGCYMVPESGFYSKEGKLDES